jgi:hypothetical protein
MNDYLSPHVLIIALTFLLAGIVKGVTGMGLATVAVGILGAIMSPVGGQKFTAHEAAGIAPFTEHSPIMSWLHALFGVQGAGFTDPQIIDIIALSAQLLLTNFMNNVAETDIDFPGVNAPQPAA